MTDTTIVAVPPGQHPSIIDWGPIVGGTLVASALSFVLFSFGSAAGVASVSPYSWNNPSLTTLSIVAVAWFVIVMIGSFLVGGYFAGRFRRPFGEAGPSERETRDGAHGLAVWGLSIVLGVAIAAAVASAGARTAATATGAAATMAAQAVPQERIAGFVDTLLRPGPQPPAAQAGGEDPRAEITRILGASWTRGEISSEDRTYMARLIAARTGLTEEEARKRVDATIEQAKQAADRARKMAAILAFLIGAASLLAAGAAYWGATMGGQHRDEALMSRA